MEYMRMPEVSDGAVTVTVPAITPLVPSVSVKLTACGADKALRGAAHDASVKKLPPQVTVTPPPNAGSGSLKKLFAALNVVSDEMAVKYSEMLPATLERVIPVTSLPAHVTPLHEVLPEEQTGNVAHQPVCSASTGLNVQAFAIIASVKSVLSTYTLDIKLAASDAGLPARSVAWVKANSKSPSESDEAVAVNVMTEWSALALTAVAAAPDIVAVAVDTSSGSDADTVTVTVSLPVATEVSWLDEAACTARMDGGMSSITIGVDMFFSDNGTSSELPPTSFKALISKANTEASKEELVVAWN
jgi:hypothetical protein